MDKTAEITVKSGRYRICGYVWHREVMSMMTIHGKWIIGSSSCLQTDVDSARLYIECMQRVLDVAAQA